MNKCRLVYFFFFLFIFTVSGINISPTRTHAFAPAALAEDSSVFKNTLIAVTNSARAERGSLPLLMSPILTKAAQRKADDMARSEYFAHTSPAGISPWHWFTSTGYRYTRAGENLAMDFDNPEKVLSAWMNSPAHRANIVKSLYTEVGIGLARGNYHGKPVTFIVQFFATPASAKSKILARKTRTG